MKKTIIFIVALCLLTGCTTTSGAKIDQNKLNQIKKGITTEKEVLSLLGDPNSRTVNSYGQTILSYSHSKMTGRITNYIPVVNFFVNGLDMKMELLIVSIDKTGKVESYYWGDSTRTLNSGLLNSQ